MIVPGSSSGPNTLTESGQEGGLGSPDTTLRATAAKMPGGLYWKIGVPLDRRKQTCYHAMENCNIHRAPLITMSEENVLTAQQNPSSTLPNRNICSHLKPAFEPYVFWKLGS